jgi:ankyrin repeat protein
MRDCDVKKIECFLRQHSENIDINRFNVDGQTALHEACQLGNVACVKTLLLFGANPILTNRDGFSILHLSAFSGNPELLSIAMNLKQ